MGADETENKLQFDSSKLNQVHSYFLFHHGFSQRKFVQDKTFFLVFWTVVVPLGVSKIFGLFLAGTSSGPIERHWSRRERHPSSTQDTFHHEREWVFFGARDISRAAALIPVRTLHASTGRNMG